MSAEISLSTSGADDAEALAGALEHLAAQIRAGGGDPVRDSGELAIAHDHGGQSVQFSMTAAP
jgi:hypothetical protein